MDARDDSGLRGLTGSPAVTGLGTSGRPRSYRRRRSEGVEVAAPAAPTAKLLESAWRASATNTDSVTFRRSAARLPGHHHDWAARSGRPQCFRPTVTVRSCLLPATLFPLSKESKPGVGCAPCRLRPTVSVPPRPQSMNRSPLAGPRGWAHSVGQGLKLSFPANCDGHLLPAFPHGVTGLRGPGPGRPRFGSCNCVDLRRRLLCLALLPRRAAGPGAHSVGQG